MTHGSLFNGIGGFQLAASWMGWENVMSCEINDFCNKITKKHFPKCIQHGDIRTIDFTVYRGKIDILTGGFPCQPFSTAGKRRGTDDSRHLWPEMLRAIREIQPRWVVGENVRGIINWNGGMVFDQVQSDLETEGYEVIPFLLPACGINASHRRERIWPIAHANSYGYRESKLREVGKSESKDKKYENKRQRIRPLIKRTPTKRATPNTDDIRQQKRNGEQKWWLSQSIFKRQNGSMCWENFPTQSPICGRNDGISYGLDGISFSKWRSESLKALGNAIVPQVAFEIFKAIESCH